MRDSTRMWTFETANFLIYWDISTDYGADLSFDETGEVRDKLNSGEWQCFMSKIAVYHLKTGIELGAAWLGGSIYADPEEFRDHFGMNAAGHGSCFSQMVREAVQEARDNLKQLCEVTK